MMHIDINKTYVILDHEKIVDECKSLLQKYTSNDKYVHIQLLDYKLDSMSKNSYSKFKIVIDLIKSYSYNIWSDRFEDFDNVIIRDMALNRDIFNLSEYNKNELQYLDIYNNEYIDTLTKYCIDEHTAYVDMLSSIIKTGDKTIDTITGNFFHGKNLNRYKFTFSYDGITRNYFKIFENVDFMENFVNPINVLKIIYTFDIKKDS